MLRRPAAGTPRASCLGMQDRIAPSKRLRNWHRITKSELPLKSYARDLALDGRTGPARERQAVARAWLASKAFARRGACTQVSRG